MALTSCRLTTNIATQLEKKLQELQGTVNEPDAIIFAGNGEPTIHPEFAGIIDNTTNEEIEAWLKVLSKINPEYVMIYPIDRGTPTKGLEKIPENELKAIAEKVDGLGIGTRVYY